MQELHQYCRHIIPSMRLYASLGNILIEEVLQHRLAILLLRQLPLNLRHERPRILLKPLPNPIASYHHELLLPVTVDFADLRKADDGLHVEGDFRDRLLREVAQGSGQVQVAVDTTIDYLGSGL